jgi:fumarate reductase subunit C
MLAERSLILLPFFAILNSIYLSYINLEEFFLERNTSEMAANLGTIFGLNIFVIIFVITLNGLRKKYETNEKKWYLIFNFYFKKKILSLILMFFLLLTFYTFSKSDVNKSFTIFLLVSIEIISISFAISSERKKAITKLIVYVICGIYLLMMPFTLFGFYEQYLGYVEFHDNSNLIIVFTAIFYHLLSACYMFYEALPKSITKYDFKEDKRKPKKMKKILTTSIVLLIFSITSVSCSFKSDSDYIQNRYWKRGSGFGLIDIIILNNENFRNDTIFINKKPIATFEKLEDFKSDLIIKSIPENQLGTYHDQGKIKENK